MSTLNVVVPQPTGVCSGVANALNALKELREKHPAARIFTNHQTVHHGAADAILEENDIAVVDPADLQYLQPGDLVVGSAHGTPQWEIDAIHRRGARFWDTACPLVSANSGWIANPRNNVVVYVGKPGHREFEAAVNRARGAHCFVVDLNQGSIDEVVRGVREIGRILPVVLIRQTTISGNDANVLRIRQALQSALPEFQFSG
ncbi:hypothetical protein KKI17_01060, partial [Patescibacteria group bacterium]|nr:hypothetical protein [Patescibacteria group bacterium]